LLGVLCPVPLRQQHLYVLSQDLGRAVAEGPLRGAVEQQDASNFVGTDDRIGHEPEHVGTHQGTVGRQRFR
jgi:hypothetical protein